jgi:hypothetical protein
MTDNDSNELHETLSRVYESRSDQESISPGWLATHAMNAIGFPRELHPLGYRGCHLHFRQMARHFCRKHFDPTEAEETDLFPETLQQRYPRRPTVTGVDPEYVLLEMLGDVDIRYNVDRLRKEAASKQKHANALEAFRRRKFPEVAA